MNLIEREEEIKKIVLNELLPLMRAKGHDYGGDDAFGNLRDFGWQGIVVRIGDKYNRLKNFCLSKELKIKDETIDDTLKDLVNYGLLALILKRAEIKTSNVTFFNCKAAGYTNLYQAQEFLEKIKNEQI